MKYVLMHSYTTLPLCWYNGDIAKVKMVADKSCRPNIISLPFFFHRRA